MRKLPDTAITAAAAFAVLSGSSCGSDADGTRTEDVSGRIDSVPLLVINGPDNDPLFGVVGAVLVDSLLVVANGGSRTLQFYRESGELVRMVGQTGEGPGEFRRLDWIQSAGQRVVAFDRQLMRVSTFTSSGEFQTSTQITPPEPHVLASAIGVFPDGSILVQVWTSGRRRGVASVYRDTLALFRYDDHGNVRDSLGSYVWSEVYTEPNPGGGEFMSNLPLGYQGHVAVQGWKYYVLQNNEFRVTVHDTIGTSIAARLRIPQRK